MKASEISKLLDDFLRVVVDGGWRYDPAVLDLLHEVAAGQTITTLSRQNNIKRSILNGYATRAEQAVKEITADRMTEYRVAMYLPITPSAVRDMVERGLVQGEAINQRSGSCRCGRR